MKVTEVATLIGGGPGELSIILGQGGNDVIQLVTRGLELHSSVEGIVGVNGEVVTWAIGIWIHLVKDGSTASALIAPPVVSFVSWVITFMRSSVPSILIGLHDVHLWAEVASNLIGIAVEVIGTRWPWIAVLIFAWHRDQIQSGVATACRLGNIHIPFDGSTENIWSIEHVLLDGSSISNGEVASATVLDRDCGARDL